MKRIACWLSFIALALLPRCSSGGASADDGGPSEHRRRIRRAERARAGASGSNTAGSDGQSGSAGTTTTGGARGRAAASGDAGSAGTSGSSGSGGDMGGGGEGGSGGAGTCEPESSDGPCNACLKGQCCDVWPACEADSDCAACTACLDDENDFGTCLIMTPPICNNLEMPSSDLIGCALEECVAECGLDS